VVHFVVHVSKVSARHPFMIRRKILACFTPTFIKHFVEADSAEGDNEYKVNFEETDTIDSP
jgi:hypothetical protein